MEKHIIQKVSRLLPSSLSSCHFKNVHPDVVHNSNLLSKTSQKPHSDHHKFKPKPKRHTNPTKLSSSSNNSGWFSSDEEEQEQEQEQEQEDQNKEVIIDKPETEIMYSLSSSFSSSDGFLNSISTRKKGQVIGRSFNSVMGNSPAVIPSEFRRQNVHIGSRRMSSASSCNLYYSDLGSFRREIIETRRRSDDNETDYRRKTTPKFHYQAKKSSPQPKTDQSSELSSTSSTNVKTTRRKTNWSTHTKNLIDDKGPSSIKSTHIYYSDLRSFRRPETGNNRRKTRKKSRGKKWKVEESYAVVKSSSDPYSDFRLSMVEMIVEKQIYGEDELEKLLEIFLSLNSSYHHDIILKVFLDVCKNLLS